MENRVERGTEPVAHKKSKLSLFSRLQVGYITPLGLHRWSAIPRPDPEVEFALEHARMIKQDDKRSREMRRALDPRNIL